MTMLAVGVIINMLLAAFNMVPLPPLDGHYILEGLGPPFVTEFFDIIRPYSFLFLMLLMWQTDWIDRAIEPFLAIAMRGVLLALGVPL